MKEAAFQKGFAAGLVAGRKQAPQPGGSAQELVEHLPRLLQLCHPDRHGGSETANKVTQFLLALRKRYRNATNN